MTSRPATTTTEHRIFIGVDPGLDGGFAIVPGFSPALAHAWVTPTTKTAHGRDFDRDKIRQMLGAFTGRYAAIEKVSAAPMRGRRQGTTSMFNFGRGYGLWLGILEGLGIPFIEVDPRRWKKAITRSLYGTDKRAAIDYVRRFHPTVDLRRTSRCTTDHDGIADAVCIAEYAKREWEAKLLLATVK